MRAWSPPTACWACSLAATLASAGTPRRRRGVCNGAASTRAEAACWMDGPEPGRAEAELAGLETAKGRKKKKKKRKRKNKVARYVTCTENIMFRCLDVAVVSAPGQRRACAGRSVGAAGRPRCARPGSSGRLFGCRVLVRPLCPHNRMTRRAIVLQGSRCRKSSTVCGKNWQKQRHKSEPRRLHHPR